MIKCILQILIIFSLTIKLSAHECEYGEYYQIVELATKQFKEQNYKEANEQFKVTFTKIDFPLGSDLDLALYATSKSTDNVSAALFQENKIQPRFFCLLFLSMKKSKNENP